MESVLVHFNPQRPRRVLANGDDVGPTDATLLLPTNYYEISLSGGGYMPAKWTGLVSGTMPDDPLEITFTPSAQPEGKNA